HLRSASSPLHWGESVTYSPSPDARDPDQHGTSTWARYTPEARECRTTFFARSIPHVVVFMESVIAVTHCACDRRWVWTVPWLSLPRGDFGWGSSALSVSSLPRSAIGSGC